ncbi:MAG: D-2-hydroxyacid dehydrogenase [Saprospiraceae bacterium]|jgi:glycerate dehydrogenase|nr:D-2-hydroxyacid dehydrogenase [Saprospiraceae bacterium]MBP6569674.1 D-2-hydroxyacid dehydrogenase [Saprospiraceae bacterium]
MNRKEIVFLDAFTNNPGDLSFESISLFGNLKVFDRTESTDLVLISERCEKEEIVIVNKFPINEMTLTCMPEVKYIVVAATGYNNIDIESVKKRNIQVSNVKGYSSESVTQHIFASILTLLNKIEYYDHQVKNGRWSASLDFCFYDHSILELSGKTMGIFGYGNIGNRVGEVAHAFGMKIIATVPNRDKVKPDYVTFVDEDAIFRDSDFLSLHCPLTDATSGIIKKSNLLKMKNTAILINTARGKLIEERDLFYALDHGVIAGAILDVLTQEPPAITNPLRNHSKCLITPHIAWAGQQSRKKLIEGIASNISAYCSGQWLNRIF